MTGVTVLSVPIESLRPVFDRCVLPLAGWSRVCNDVPKRFPPKRVLCCGVPSVQTLANTLGGQVVQVLLAKGQTRLDQVCSREFGVHF